MRRVCVFCGSKMGVAESHQRLARELGMGLARRGLGVVTGGGSVGLMGAVAEGCLAAGGDVVGVIPRALARPEVAHEGLSRLEVVADMHVRKARMSELSMAFVALPGGLGTLEELFEVLTWRQLGFHRKPIAVLGPASFWQPLDQLLDHMEREGFLYPTARQLLTFETRAEQLLESLLAQSDAPESSAPA